MVYQDKESGKAFVKKFQIGGVTRDKLYPLAKAEGSTVAYFARFATEKSIPKKLTITVDGRSGARLKEFNFDLTEVPISNRNAKGVTVTKWLIKNVKPVE
jgi:topoisomerase-4 subunit A